MSVEPTGDLGVLTVDQVQDVTGHVVFAEGADEHGAEALAMWHVSAAGTLTGSWVTPVDRLAGDPEAARQLLWLTSRRAVIGWDASAAEPLSRLAHWAKRPDPQAPVVVLPEALAEIAERRTGYEAAVAEHRQTTKSKLQPLEWEERVPTATSWSEFAETVGIPRPQAPAPVAAEALHLARAVGWVIRLWQDTESVRARRSYLVDRFGPAAPLPPRWLERLRQAHQSVER